VPIFQKIKIALPVPNGMRAIFNRIVYSWLKWRSEFTARER
jgi:hypothetical protein